VKVLRVGVLAEGSSARISSTGFGSTKKVLLGRGVVGVVSSPGRACGGSGTGKVVLTAWKVDMLRTGRLAVWRIFHLLLPVLRWEAAQGYRDGGARIVSRGAHNSRAGLQMRLQY
jgi:hypothetical protein